MKFCPLHLPPCGDDFTVGRHYPVRHTGFPYAASRPAAAGRFSGDHGQRLAARCVTRNNGVFRCHAAGAFTWAHCGVSEMTSSSSLGSTRIILQFDFDRYQRRSAMCRRRSTPRKVCYPADAQPSDLSQSEPVGCANNDPDADVRYLFAG